MFRHRRIMAVVLIAGIVVGLARLDTSQAQSPQTEEFMGGGVNNLIVYPAANQAEAEIARATASEILGKLAVLFTGGYAPLRFESLVHLADEIGPDNAYATAGLENPADAAAAAGVTHSFSTSQVCLITVYTAGITTPDILPFNMAHETAHCMEEAYIAPTRVNLELAGWWTEGIADWAATLSYPNLAVAGLAGGPNEGESLFLSDNNHSLTDSVSARPDYEGYGSYFFWLYLTSLGDPATVIDLISRVPPTPSGEEAYQDYLANEFDSAATMGHLGVMLAQDRVPYQVDRDLLFGSYQTIQMPQSVTFAPNDFTLDFNGFEVERGSEDVKAVEISTTGLSDPASDILLAVDVGGIFTYVQDGAPALICLQADSVFVPTVLTRGDGDSAVDFDLNFNPITEEDSPCSEPVNPGTPLVFPAWRAVNVGDPSIPDARVLFLDINDDTTIEVWRGPDMVYTRSGGTGPYTGTTLLPPGYDSYTATLDIIDASTRASQSVGVAGAFTYESSYEYFLTDEPYFLLTEINRQVLDYSMFSSCIGFDVMEPGRTWTTPDPLVPMRIDREAGVLYLGGQGYTGSGIYTEVTLEPDSPMGSLETVFTISLTGDQIAYIRFESTLDGRADCRIVYESMLIPYNGDLEELIASSREE